MVAGRDQAAQRDQRVASPVQKPRIPGNDCAQLVTFDHIERQRIGHALGQRHLTADRRLFRSAMGLRLERRLGPFIVAPGRERRDVAPLQRQRKPARAEEIAGAIQAAFLLFRMRHHVEPFVAR